MKTSNQWSSRVISWILYTSITQAGRFEVLCFKPDEGTCKRMTMWNTVKTHFQQLIQLKTITKQTVKVILLVYLFSI